MAGPFYLIRAPACFDQEEFAITSHAVEFTGNLGVGCATPVEKLRHDRINPPRRPSRRVHEDGTGGDRTVNSGLRTRTQRIIGPQQRAIEIGRHKIEPPVSTHERKG